MALIKCPECGKEISDKVKACPHCGFPLVEESAQMLPNLTNPQEVEVTGVKIKNLNTKRFLIIGFAFVAFLILAIVGYKLYSEQKAKKDYETAFNIYVDNITTAQNLMLTAGTTSEEIANLTMKVWSNAIYKESDSETDKYTRPNGIFVSDFNIVLAILFEDPLIVAKVSFIKNNQDDVKDMMKKLQNPPKGLESCYSTITDLYSTYLGFTSLAINPSGSYISFSADFREKDSGFVDIYHKLEAEIPEKIPTSK